ncbi:DUF742 domain-containing protein [Amycolatopsis nigrescens]|uniref:DUF742 domain-containing protein n=1 Tax=Amycolatopsis nigrescens TaxID=381445 RepID=UPI000373A6A1|nr:DUF742 domain-containing protein [Amycolatopsis nigrescens]
MDERPGEPPAARLRHRHRAAVRRTAGARFPSTQLLERYSEPDDPITEEFPAVPAPRPPGGSTGAFQTVQAMLEPAGSRSRVRPYVLTRGRTKCAHQLAIETLVSIRDDARWEGDALGSEYQPVRALCTTPRSVAEVAALLSVPLGVARVLLSDMADLDLVRIHGNGTDADGRPQFKVLRRVLDGLHRL